LIHLGKKKIDPSNDPFHGFGGNPFDLEITWNELIVFSKKDLQRYRDKDALISIAMIQALDAELGHVVKINEKVDNFVDFLIQQIRCQWRVKVRRQNLRPLCIKVEARMLIEVKVDFSISVDEIPVNPQHQMCMSAYLNTDLRADSKTILDIMSNLKQFYDAI
jgi:hypothetical protein